MLLAQRAFVGSDPLTAGFETRIGLFSSTQDHAQANRRTLADLKGLIQKMRTETFPNQRLEADRHLKRTEMIVDFHWHDTRHHFSSNAIMAGEDLRILVSFR
jgi:hypothetical protein